MVGPIVKHMLEIPTHYVECPFELRILKNDECGDSWSSMITIFEHIHNYTENMAAYSSAGNLTESELETVHRLSSIGAKPRVLISTLTDQNASNFMTARDIPNMKISMKRKELGGGTHIEALLDVLTTRNIWRFFRQDQSNKLKGLLISPTPTRTITKKYVANKIFLMDTTFITNRYHMPLLYGVGVTASDQTFTLFYCFLRFVNEEFHSWAMHEFKNVYGPKYQL